MSKVRMERSTDTCDGTNCYVLRKSRGYITNAEAYELLRGHGPMWVFLNCGEEIDGYYDDGDCWEVFEDSELNEAIANKSFNRGYELGLIDGRQNGLREAEERAVGI